MRSFKIFEEEIMIEIFYKFQSTVLYNSENKSILLLFPGVLNDIQWFSFTPWGLIQILCHFHPFHRIRLSAMGANSRGGAYCKKEDFAWGLNRGRGLIEG